MAQAESKRSKTKRAKPQPSPTFIKNFLCGTDKSQSFGQQKKQPCVSEEKLLKLVWWGSWRSFGFVGPVVLRAQNGCPPLPTDAGALLIPHKQRVNTWKLRTPVPGFPPQKKRKSSASNGDSPHVLSSIGPNKLIKLVLSKVDAPACRSPAARRVRTSVGTGGGSAAGGPRRTPGAERAGLVQNENGSSGKTLPQTFEHGVRKGAIGNCGKNHE